MVGGLTGKPEKIRVMGNNYSSLLTSKFGVEPRPFAQLTPSGLLSLHQWLGGVKPEQYLDRRFRPSGNQCGYSPLKALSFSCKREGLFRMNESAKDSSS